MYRVVFVSFSLLVCAGCSVCSDTEIKQTTSVRGERATVIVRDCGATTDFATVVQVGGYWKTAVVAVKGREDVVPLWSADGTELQVRVPVSVNSSDVFVKAIEAKGVRIVVQRR
jgi:hypothetical protein